MAKTPKIVSPTGEEIDTTPPVPKITGCVPVGTQVLLEFLTLQEMIGTNLFVQDEQEVSVPRHAYVKAIGPRLVEDNWGFKVGDRILFSGAGVMVPNYDDCHRERFICEPGGIKAVLPEETK
jgi:hypothetical protein